MRYSPHSAAFCRAAISRVQCIRRSITSSLQLLVGRRAHTLHSARVFSRRSLSPIDTSFAQIREHSKQWSALGVFAFHSRCAGAIFSRSHRVTRLFPLRCYLVVFRFAICQGCALFTRWQWVTRTNRRKSLQSMTNYCAERDLLRNQTENAYNQHSLRLCVRE